MRSAATAVLLIVACGKDPPPFTNDDAAPAPRCTTPISGTNVRMRMITQVNGSATHIVSPPNNDPRLFILEQRGSIRIIDANERLLPTPFLDLSGDAGGPIIAGGENGMLGLAFHPQFANNGLFFIAYTSRNTGDPNNPQLNVLARCGMTANPDVADPDSCVDVISIPDPFSNHNGGMIEFGPDGFLYWATGDGGSAGDPNRNGQSLVDGSPLPVSRALLAKMLRIDVDNKDTGKEYGIPDDNPFAAGGGAPEIFMIGLRNAWRWTFDRVTGDMWIADVGQGAIEEVTVLRPSEQNGANLGWANYEGTACFREPCGNGTIFPQVEHNHSTGWASISGGQVYRGGCFPDLVGTYFYTDHVKGGLASATLGSDGTVIAQELDGQFPGKGSSIHEGGATHELYETDTNGNVFQLVVMP
jgi:glucose/arabinose dehydrogenase